MTASLPADLKERFVLGECERLGESGGSDYRSPRPKFSIDDDFVHIIRQTHGDVDTTEWNRMKLPPPRDSISRLTGQQRMTNPCLFGWHSILGEFKSGE